MSPHLRSGINAQPGGRHFDCGAAGLLRDRNPAAGPPVVVVLQLPQRLEILAGKIARCDNPLQHADAHTRSSVTPGKRVLSAAR